MLGPPWAFYSTERPNELTRRFGCGLYRPTRLSPPCRFVVRISRPCMPTVSGGRSPRFRTSIRLAQSLRQL